MNKFRFTIKIMALAIFMFAFASIAQAQATRTWVSGVGDDANPCSRTAPCKTFAGAISKTARFGEINCLDPGGFGAVTITKSITIDCHEIFASVLHTGVTGMIINFDSFDQVLDTQKSVRIRNINFNGANTGVIGVRILGGTTNSANSKVFIEDCLMDGNFAGSQRGISDERVGNANVVLSVHNTTIRNMGAAGISIPGSSASRVSVSNSLISNCGFGIAATNSVRVVAFMSTIVSNSGPGIEMDGGSSCDVDHCMVSNNVGAAFVANGTNSVLRVSNTTAINNTGLLATITGGGAVSSYGNNQTGGTAFPSAGTQQQ